MTADNACDRQLRLEEELTDRIAPKEYRKTSTEGLNLDEEKTRQMTESRPSRWSRTNDCEASKNDGYGCTLSHNGNTSASHVHQ